MSGKTPDAKPLGETCLIGADRYILHSQHVGDDFTIDIAMPSPAGDRKPGVLVVLDGNLTFPSAIGLARGLSVQPGGPPPLCVVGVGYKVSGRGEQMEHHKIRNRDLTPCPDPRFEAMMRRAPPPFTWDDDAKQGDAAAFRAFLLEELLPWLAGSFDVDTDDRTLAGISLGGLFVLDTLFVKSSAFRRYVAISPAIWWADQRLLAQIQAAPRLSYPVDPYLAVGAEEEAQDTNAGMVSNLKKLVNMLEDRADPNLRMSYDILAGEGHMTVFSPAFGRALHRVYPAEDRRADWARLNT